MAFEKDGVKITTLHGSYFGRTVLKTSLSENELNPINLMRMLEDVLPTHFNNRKQIDYLIGVYRGNQDILNKTKLIRPEINNKVVENTSFHIVEFKKGYVYGDPIQYVQRGDSWRDEIDKLNKIMLNNDKHKKDLDLAEYQYIAGQSYRMVLPNKDENKPAVFYTLNPKDAGVVYSTSYDGEPMVAFYLSPKMNYSTKGLYYVLTVYTKKNVFVFKTNENANGDFTTELSLSYIRDEQPIQEVNPLGYIPIIEYPLNQNRLGLVELVLDMQNAINLITSNDLDDIEQYVNALMVFYNADFTTDEFKKMIEAGAVNLKSNADRGQQASAEILTNKLQHSETKVLFDRIYNNMLTIAGVPRMTEKTSSGDTGQARLVGEGWTMADQRAKQDELAFKASEKRFLDILLSILEQKPNTGLKNLKTSDIEIKFTRNKSDNLLTKTQALLQLKEANVDPYTAFNVVSLFSDSNEVVNASKAYHGEEGFWKQQEPSTNPTNDDTVIPNGSNQT